MWDLNSYHHLHGIFSPFLSKTTNELPTNNKLGKGRNIVVEKVNKGKGFVLHLNLPYLHAGINIWIRLDIFLLFSSGQFR